MSEAKGGSGIPMRSEVWRKALHLLSLLIPIGLFLFGRQVALVILVPMAAFAVAIELLRTRAGAVRDLVEKVFGFMMRPEELPPVPAPIRFNGATWVLMTSALLIALFPAPIAAAAIAIGLVGDAAAALIGRSWGRTPIWKSSKTVEGSLGFVAASAPIIWLVPGLTIQAGIAGALAGAVVEAFDLPINDNFAVPMVAAVVMLLLSP